MLYESLRAVCINFYRICYAFLFKSLLPPCILRIWIFAWCINACCMHEFALRAQILVGCTKSWLMHCSRPNILQYTWIVAELINSSCMHWILLHLLIFAKLIHSRKKQILKIIDFYLLLRKFRSIANHHLCGVYFSYVREVYLKQKWIYVICWSHLQKIDFRSDPFLRSSW